VSLVEVEDLTVRLDDGGGIVEGIRLAIEPGRVMGLVGESGSGKSTVGLALLGYTRRGARIAGGRVCIGGTELLGLPPSALRARGEVVAYVPQDPSTALNPRLSIRTQLLEALVSARGRPRGEEALSRARELLADVGLPTDGPFLRRRPHELSGGQQQRVAIAMALMCRPRLIVLDEPTTGLDVSTQAKVLALVRRHCSGGETSAVYVSHDLAVVAEVADELTVMYGGRVLEQGTATAVLRTPAHPYTRALLDAVPSVRHRLRLRAIDGAAPPPGAAPGGCVFAPRCPHTIAACLAAEPEQSELAPGHLARCLRVREVSAAPRVHVARVPDPPQAEGEPLLSVRELDAFYGGRQVLFGVSMQLRAGECVAVVGESGSGKTTMSKCLAGLHEECSAEVLLDGRPLPLPASRRDRQQRRTLQYVFQNPYASLNPRRTVGDSLAVPLAHFFDMRGASARARVAEVLERVGLPGGLAHRYPAELSGGQRQRVAIARGLLCSPGVLVCDEVTSALDVSVQAAVIELLRGLLREGLGMVFVTHDLAVVRSIADRAIVLKQGRVVEEGRVASVLQAPSHPYTRALLADTAELQGRETRGATSGVPAVQPVS